MTTLGELKVTDGINSENFIDYLHKCLRDPDTRNKIKSIIDSCEKMDDLWLKENLEVISNGNETL